MRASSIRGYRRRDARGNSLAPLATRHCSRRKRCQVGWRVLDFLALYSAKNVVAEGLWFSEKLGFRTTHRHARAKFKRDKVQCADKIGQLEKAVFCRSKWRKIISATCAETFPRIQVVPVFQPSPTSMIPYSFSLCNGASASASSHNSTFLKEAA